MEDEADFHVVAEVSKEAWPSHLKVDVPDFSVRDCTDINLIGLGAFGEVSACVYREHKYVLKQLNVGYDRIQSRDMYIKELKLLESVRGHNNIIHIRAYCFSERYFMLDYMRFSFDCLGIECQQVSSLDKFFSSMQRLHKVPWLQALATPYYHGCSKWIAISTQYRYSSSRFESRKCSSVQPALYGDGAERLFI